LVSFILYGPFLVLCQKLGLVRDVDAKVTKPEERILKKQQSYREMASRRESTAKSSRAISLAEE